MESPCTSLNRGNNRQACFFADDDYRFYLDWLLEYSFKAGCAIHAYVIVTNNVHRILTPKNQESAGNLMKRLGQCYVKYVNRTYKRIGTFWGGRFRSRVIQQDAYSLPASAISK